MIFLNSWIYFIYFSVVEIENIFWRSKPYNPGSKDGGGENFVVHAFISDVEQDVVEGLDGIEHM